MVNLNSVFSKRRVLIDLSHVAFVTDSSDAILRSVAMLGYMILSVFCSALRAVLIAALLELRCHLRCHACNFTSRLNRQVASLFHALKKYLQCQLSSLAQLSFEGHWTRWPRLAKMSNALRPSTEPLCNLNL